MSKICLYCLSGNSQNSFKRFVNNTHTHFTSFVRSTFPSPNRRKNIKPTCVQCAYDCCEMCFKHSITILHNEQREEQKSHVAKLYHIHHPFDNLDK